MMKSFLAGIGIGLGLGMLFAPMSGQETRENIRERANDLADQARDAVQQGSERVRSKIQAVRGGVERAVSQTGTGPATGTEGV
jgi:gas vesicle protein